MSTHKVHKEDQETENFLQSILDDGLNDVSLILHDDDKEAANLLENISDDDLDDLSLILHDLSENDVTWNHIVNALRQRLYDNIANTVNKIVNNKENEIKQWDLSPVTVNKVLNILTCKKSKMSHEEYQYIQKLIKHAQEFNPSKHNVTQQSAAISCRRFTYRYDFDTKGLLYCLGTKGTLHHGLYVNPAVSGSVEVTSTELQRYYMELSTITGRETKELRTISQKAAFISINLKNVKIRLTHYTLRYYNQDWKHPKMPRNWQLKGSNNGKTWAAIKTHINDKSLRPRDDTHTWKVRCNQFYSYFKLESIGVHCGNYYGLSISGIELYGDAYGDKIIMDSKLHQKYSQLTVGLLQDIYDVHRAFKFQHFHMSDYQQQQYVEDVMKQINID
eukprot:181435_1